MANLILLAAPASSNTGDGIEPRAIAIYSELALPAKDDPGAGSMTRRITARRLSGVESTAQRYHMPAAPKSAPAPVRAFVPGNAASPDLLRQTMRARDANLGFVAA